MGAEDSPSSSHSSGSSKISSKSDDKCDSIGFKINNNLKRSKSCELNDSVTS